MKKTGVDGIDLGVGCIIAGLMFSVYVVTPLAIFGGVAYVMLRALEILGTMVKP